MKKCSTCKKVKDIESFYKDRSAKSGRSWRCKECESNKVRKWNEKTLAKRHASHLAWGKTEKGKLMSKRKNKKSQERYPEKFAAREACRTAVRKGILVKGTSCHDCGTTDSKLWGDHYKGYAKVNWLEVQWVCPKCSYWRDVERGINFVRWAIPPKKKLP